MATAKRANSVSKLGGGIAYIIECDIAGTSSGSPIELPIIKQSTIRDNTPLEDDHDEAGVNYPSHGNRVVEWEGQFMQRDADTLQAVINTHRGKFYHIIQERTAEMVNGNYEYFVGGIAQFEPSIEHTTLGNTVTWKAKVLRNAAALSIDGNTGTTAFQGSPGATIAVPAGQYWAISAVAS